MDRVCRLDSLLILCVPTLGRELRLLRPVEVRQRARHYIAVLELSRICQRLEQPPPHDLETFLGAGWSPRGFHPPHDVAKPIKRLAPTLTANLDIISLRVRRAPRVRGRQADHQ